MVYKAKPTLIFMILLTAIFILQNAYAQEGKAPVRGPDPEQAVERLQQALGLTEEQASQVKPIINNDVAKRKALMQEAKAKKQAIFDELKANMDKVSEATEAKLAKYLTKEQLAKWKELREERHKRFKKPNDGERFGPKCKGENRPIGY